MDVICGQNRWKKNGSANYETKTGQLETIKQTEKQMKEKCKSLFNRSSKRI